MAQDTELSPALARAIVQQPGEYRFTVPATRRDNAREWLRRSSRSTGARVTTRTGGDTMWVRVQAQPVHTS